jgi:hypothetical protein
MAAFRGEYYMRNKWQNKKKIIREYLHTTSYYPTLDKSAYTADFISKIEKSALIEKKEKIIYHHSVGECSILRMNAPLYILVKEPKITGNMCSSDPIRTPLDIGYNLTDILTPNLYSKKFIDNIIQDSSKYKNPFTNEKVITYIPLTSNPSLIEEKMELVIGKCQYMNHLVNVYISIMINGLIKYPWMKDSEEIIIEHLRELIQNITSLNVSIDNLKEFTFYEKLMSLINKLDKLSHGEKVTIYGIVAKCFSVDLLDDDLVVDELVVDELVVDDLVVDDLVVDDLVVGEIKQEMKKEINYEYYLEIFIIFFIVALFPLIEDYYSNRDV